jgi:hypothetical protein
LIENAKNCNILVFDERARCGRANAHNGKKKNVATLFISVHLSGEKIL